MEALLISGGETPSKGLVEKHIRSADIIICADSGLHVLKDEKVIPDILIGDMDSVDQELLKEFVSKSVEVIRLNPIKDYSDTHCAIEELRGRGIKKLTILGGLGLRMDHSLSNLFSMEHFIDDLEITLVDDHNRMTIHKKGNYQIPSEDYSYLSLFCLSDHCNFSVANTKYEVEKFENIRGNPIGLSNEIMEDEAELKIHSGLVLIVQSKD